jgi:hypothetical protein
MGVRLRLLIGACLVGLVIGAAPLSARTPPAHVNHLFLCYSKFQSDPGVWEFDLATPLLAAGYWTPYAVAGNVNGATNIGEFHLMCNLTRTTLHATGAFADDAGATWPASFATIPGLYPIVG